MNKENCALKLVDEIILYIRYTLRLVCKLVSACLIELNELNELMNNLHLMFIVF